MAHRPTTASTSTDFKYPDMQTLRSYRKFAFRSRVKPKVAAHLTEGGKIAHREYSHTISPPQSNETDDALEQRYKNYWKKMEMLDKQRMKEKELALYARNPVVFR
mmetsp:Transcript_2064/g.3752  ORF Transcript_2064/g.3752 Transcript_2064/m.3752 type:complete len:105 (+) Transcript_2064:141-455(+)